jgi:FxsC-like protein
MTDSGSRGTVAQERRVRPYFFLSYARTPRRDPVDRINPDRWVHKLYRDLCGEILQMTDIQPEEAGFMDSEIRIGAEWSRELTNALKTCRVFVPLYSRRYFESENCGREWFAFAQREVTHRARGGERADAIVPALWTRLANDNIPPIAQRLQYHHASLGERYRADGFYGIMKLTNYRTDYQRAVLRLAELIIEIGDRSVAHADEVVEGMEQRDFESLQSAFGPNSARRTTNGRLQITVLAHDTSTLPPGRAREYYGDTPGTWKPYQPNYPQPVAEYALELARKCLDCDPLVEVFERDVSDGENPDGENREDDELTLPPGLCLVDAWVCQSPAHHARLSQLNQLAEPWVSVLLPWNTQDREMIAADAELRDNLQQHLGLKLDGVPRRCRMAATGIPTIQDFSQVLSEMTMLMLKRFRKDAPAHPPMGPVIPRPRLRRAESEEPGGPQ